MPSTPGRTATWFVNGEPIRLKSEPNVFNYTFDKSGDYVITYVETEGPNESITSASRGMRYVRVVPMPSVTSTIDTSTEMSYLPPVGYGKHHWTLNGQTVSNDDVFKHVYTTPGTYNVECLATNPDQGHPDGFLRVRYITKVNQK